MFAKDKLDRLISKVKNHKLNITSKLFKQLLLSNIIIALSTIIVMNLATFFISKNIIKQNFFQSNEFQLNEISIKTDNLIKEIFKINSSLDASYGILYNYNQWEEKDKTSELFLEWLSTFRMYLKQYDYVDSVVIYKKDFIIDTERGIKNNNNYSDFNTVVSLVSSAKANYKHLVPYISDPYYNKYKETEIISFITPIKSADSSYNSGAIIINVSYNSIKNKLLESLDSSKNIFLIYNKATSSLFIKSSNEISIPTSLLYEIGEKISKTQSDISNSPDQIIINKKKFLYNQKDSEYVNNWMYIALFDYSVIRSSINLIIIALIIIIVITILIEILFSYITSKCVYNPIKQIITNIKNLLEISNEDDVATINKYIYKLEKTNIKSTQTITEYTPKIIQSITLDILQNNCLKFTDVQNNLSSFNIHFIEPYFLILIFSIDQFLILSEKIESDSLVTRKNIIFDDINIQLQESYNCIGTPIQNNRFAIIINTDINFEFDKFENIFKKTNQVISNKYNVTASVSISTLINDTKSLPLEYNRVISFFKERLTKGDEAILTELDLRIPKLNSTSSINKQINELVYAVSQRNPKKIQELLDNLWLKLEQMGADDIKYVVNKLVALTEQSLTGKSGLFNFTSYYKRIDQIFMYTTFEFLKEYINEFAMRVSSCFADDNSTDFASNIKLYIDCNYNKDISLTHLSDMFKLSPPYISSIFKLNNGIGIIDYLNIKRIDKAKEMLENTNIHISLIGKKTGFSTYNSFSRVFKQLTGMTAKDYKNKFTGDNSTNNN